MTDRKPTCVACKGAGGGATYTAGNGISISAENEISVDTTTIQEKLTAGDNITIVDNVISASSGEWKIADPTKWGNCVNNQYIAQYDMILYLKANATNYYAFFLKKDCIVQDIIYKRTINLKGWQRLAKENLFNNLSTSVNPTIALDTSYAQSGGILTITYDNTQTSNSIPKVSSYSDYNTRSTAMLLLTKEDIE